MSNILVTGGAGFIGSHVVDELITLGHAVWVLDDLSGGFMGNVNPKATFIKGSITDKTLVKELFERSKYDYVFHLAAYAAEGLSHFIKRYNYENNLTGSVNLINASINHKVKCVVFTSSIAVYGKNRLPMTEELVPMPEDSYGIAKLAVEMELKISKQIFGLNYIIFRPHNVYGERQNIGDAYRNVIGIFMNQIMNGSQLTIWGNGEQTRAFSYIRDIAPIIARSAFEPKMYGEIFNIGYDDICSINKLVNLVCQEFGIKPNIRYLEPRNEVKHAYCSHEKIWKFYKNRATIPLNEGLRKMAAWAKQTGARKSKKFNDIEIIKNLPRYWLEELKS